MRKTDIVIQKLKLRKALSHRYHKVVQSKYQPKIKLPQETFCKKRSKKRTYQEKFNVNKFQKISKNKVAASAPTSTSETDQTSEINQDEVSVTLALKTIISHFIVVPHFIY